MGLEEVANNTQALVDVIKAVAEAITSLMGVCSAIAAAFPKPKGNGVLKAVHSVVNLLGCNVGYARNAADAPKAEGSRPKPWPE